MANKAKSSCKAKEAEEFARLAAANPYRFFSYQIAGKICGFGVNTITALVDAGAPVVARKINPGMLLEWIKSHPDAVGKIREDEAE